jgi:hypothetical protein
VDVTETAKEAGFKLPVAITEALHCRLSPTKADQCLGQDYDGRLWDVLWLAAFTIKLADRGADTVTFTVACRRRMLKAAPATEHRSPPAGLLQPRRRRRTGQSPQHGGHDRFP